MDCIKIYNEDCLKFLETIEDNSIDCVITDPPYFIDKLDNVWDEDILDTNKANSHIKHLPKGMKFSKSQSEELYKYYKNVSNLIFKKIKPGGYFLSFSSPRLYHSIASAIDHSGFEIRDMINWIYTQTMPKGMGVNRQIENLNISLDEKEKLKKKYENYKTPQLKSCFEPICVAMKPINTTFLLNELKYNTGLLNFNSKTGDDKIPSNIITTENIDDFYDKNFLVKKPNKNEKGNDNNHISVKPIELMIQLIEIFSKKNSIILDPFMGSGTTGIACIKTDRVFIGIEKNKKYFKICEKRLYS